MKRLSFFKLQMLTAVLVLFVGVALLQKRLNQQRANLGLTRVAPLENAPPVLAFTTVALGSFRGLIANALWIRANDMQLEDKFFEQVQLADWITKLQPSMVQVWLVQAWNMAYNISVKFRDPLDRWRWVEQGIELLRDRGLRYNPKEPLIYRELSWFFQHKIGQTMDDAHGYYKYAWATNMAAVLDGGRPNYDELQNPTTPAARERLRLLTERYKMEPAMMKKVDALYGPLEWRLPEASAIYWASVGLEKSNSKDLLNLRRVIYQCMHTVVLRGRIVHVRQRDGMLSYGPDLTKISLAHEGYVKMLAEEKEKPEAVQRAHRNYLKEVVYLLYARNRREEADQWMKILRQRYPEAVPKDQTAEQFALARLTEGIGNANHNRTRALLESLLFSHFESLAVDDDDHAAGLLQMASKVNDYYNDVISKRGAPLSLDPFPVMYQRVREELLSPQSGMSPVYRARLRTKLGLGAEPPPAPSTGSGQAPATNAPPAAAKSG